MIHFISTWQNVLENDQDKRRKRKLLFQKRMIPSKVNNYHIYFIYFYLTLKGFTHSKKKKFDISKVMITLTTNPKYYFLKIPRSKDIAI